VRSREREFNLGFSPLAKHPLQAIPGKRLTGRSGLTIRFFNPKMRGGFLPGVRINDGRICDDSKACKLIHRFFTLERSVKGALFLWVNVYHDRRLKVEIYT
jgi:hypothetical protein